MYNEMDDPYALGYCLTADRIELLSVNAAPFDNGRSASYAQGVVDSYNETLRVYEHCNVDINVQTSTITITFTDGLPSLLPQLQEAIEKIIHAHLGTVYKVIFSYEQLGAYTHAKLAEFTHDELKNGIPVEGVT